MNKEVWKDIKGYEGYYQISNFGNVRNFKLKLMKPHKTYRGYLRIGLTKDMVQTKFSIHRLVAEAFIPNPENKEYVNHIDGNKEFNCVLNLEWATHMENEIHAMSNGLKGYKPVIQYDLNLNYVNEFDSIIDAHLRTNTNKSGISECCNGKQKTAGGYIWKFKTLDNLN